MNGATVRAMFISIHAPRTGSDTHSLIIGIPRGNFNPRSPHGERQGNCLYDRHTCEFQSTLPARGATQQVHARCAGLLISIHAPRTGSDPGCKDSASLNCPISIHAPRTGSDLRSAGAHPALDLFQSTLPARGATITRLTMTFWQRSFQSTLPARGATPVGVRCARALMDFNPRSPHGERHATAKVLQTASDFNPRSPHGERRIWRDTKRGWKQFQSTLPARGAT